MRVRTERRQRLVGVHRERVSVFPPRARGALLFHRRVCGRLTTSRILNNSLTGFCPPPS